MWKAFVIISTGWTWIECWRLLPMYMVTAFIKKLSRMALTAPPYGVLLIIELVINLLVRHNTCRALVHRDTPCDLTSDPYLPEERDLQKCKASESSLWEIKVYIYIIAVTQSYYIFESLSFLLSFLWTLRVKALVFRRYRSTGFIE